MKPFARSGLEFVYDPSCTAELVSGGANRPAFQTPAPVERLSAIAYGAANSSTRNTIAFPSTAAAPTMTPPDPGLGASGWVCPTTRPVGTSGGKAPPQTEPMNAQPSLTTGVVLNPVPSPVEL